MNRSPKWSSVLPALIIPFCFGMILYLGLSAAIEREMIVDETLLRYLTGHPISKVTTILFFIGISSLAMIGLNVTGQIRSLDNIGELFRDFVSSNGSKQGSQTAAVEGEAAAESDTEAETSESPSDWAGGLPRAMHDHYLAKRLEGGVEFCERGPSRESFEDELKYLADIDQDRQSQRYSLVRILIWATPMLGFLGTVLGISQALGGISVGPDNDFGQMMNELRSSLFVAFDTTALALVLSIVLMFGQFLVDRFETQLLQMVDHRSRQLLALLSPSENKDLTREELEAAILRSNQALIHKQTDIWRNTIESAEQAWIDSLTSVNQEVQNGLTEAIDESVSNLSDYLGQAIGRADTAMDRRWQQWQVALSDGARQLYHQQIEMNRHTDLMVRMLANSARLAGNESVSEPVESESETPQPLSKVESNENRTPIKRMTRSTWDQFQHPVVEQDAIQAKRRDVILQFPENESDQPQDDVKRAA